MEVARSPLREYRLRAVALERLVLLERLAPLLRLRLEARFRFEEAEFDPERAERLRLTDELRLLGV